MNSIAYKYARALVDFWGKAKFLEQLSELRKFYNLTLEVDNLNLYFKERFVPRLKKIETLDKIKEVVNLDLDLRNFLLLLIQRGRMNILKDILEEMDKIQKSYQNKLLLKLQVPFKIQKELRDEVREKLSFKLKKDLELEVLERPQLLFGFRIYFDHKLLDFSLDEFYYQLKGGFVKYYEGEI